MPPRPRSHRLETESANALRSALPAAWVAREVLPGDYGIDFTVEIFTDNGGRTARSFHVQLRATDEDELDTALRRRIRFGLEVIEYYRALPIPVLVVLYHSPTNQLFARWFHSYDPHVPATRRPDGGVPETLGFPLSEADVWADKTPAALDDGVRGFLAFRSPSLELPLPLVVNASGDVDDLLPVTFALRSALAPVADLVRVEQRAATAREASVRLSAAHSRISLADVVTVTLDHDEGAPRDPAAIGRELAVALAVVLAKVGQANLAAQIGLATSAHSRIISAPDVSFALAFAMFEARRLREAITLSEQLDSSDDENMRVASTAFEMALLAARRLGVEDRAIALKAAERRIARRLERGERAQAAAAAYTLAMRLRVGGDLQAAVVAFKRAAELDARYEERGYFHRDLAGAYFGANEFGLAAEHYGRAIELGDTGLVEALYADALLFAGRYADAAAKFDDYLRTDRGPHGAEWRIKCACLPLIRARGGDHQLRDIAQADELIEPVDFQHGTITSEEALTRIEHALAVDACCGEAWFRLALIRTGLQEDLATQAPLFLTAAALLRAGPGAWMNAVISALSMAPDEALIDMLQVAYRVNRDRLLDEVVRGTDGFGDRVAAERILALLDRAIVIQDDLDRTPGFVLRLTSDDGMVREIVVGEDPWMR